MAGGASPSTDLSVAVDQLTNSNQLKKLIQDNAKPVFKFGTEIALFWTGAVGSVPKGTTFSFAISDKANWKTDSTGIGFGLNVRDKCKLEVLHDGDAVIQYVPNLPPIGTTDVSSAKKEDLPAVYDGAYLKLSLDFDIQGNVSGSGNIGALGISGKAAAGAGASLVFCHHVSKDVLLKDAVDEAFQTLVFPFDPATASDVHADDLALVNFNATFSGDLELSYGIAKYNFAAPSVDTVLSSVTNAAKLSLPSVKLDIGASAKIGYSHADDFTGIIQKLSNSDTFLYLMRAHKDAVNGTVSVAAQFNITGTAGVIPDKQKIQQAVDGITNGLAGSQVAAKADELAQKLNNSLNNWITNEAKKGVALSETWDRQTSTAMLFKYKVNASDIAAVNQSWQSFCLGDIRSAVGAGGLILQSGSGINHDLSQSITLEFHFFNFFSAKDVSTYFQNTSVVITETGDVKFMFDIGDERDQTINAALQKFRLHFVGSAQAKVGAEVDLYIELTATNKASAARHIGAVAGYLPSNVDTNTAYNDMQAFAQTGSGTLQLICVVKRSAYSKLTCSEYINRRPPIDQTLDEQNWDKFKDAAIRLLDVDFASKVSFATWQGYSIAVTGGTIADRKNIGNFNGSQAMTFWDVRQLGSHAIELNYFCTNCSEFMDLCDDLHVLAGIVRQASIPADWNSLLGYVRDIVQRDVNTDYGMAAAAAILGLCAPQSITYEKEAGTNSLTCTLTIS